MSFRFILTKIEYFYREKPLHLSTVVRTGGGGGLKIRDFGGRPL